jgi:hypothetical protein
VITDLVEPLQQVLYSALNLFLAQRGWSRVVADADGVGGLYRGDKGGPQSGGLDDGTNGGRAEGAGGTEDGCSEHCCFVLGRVDCESADGWVRWGRFLVDW